MSRTLIAIAAFIAGIAVTIGTQQLDAELMYRDLRASQSQSDDFVEQNTYTDYGSDECSRNAEAVQLLGGSTWKLGSVSKMSGVTFASLRKEASTDNNQDSYPPSFCVELPTEFPVPEKVRLTDGKLVSAD